MSTISRHNTPAEQTAREFGRRKPPPVKPAYSPSQGSRVAIVVGSAVAALLAVYLLLT
jgi:hypothetical protein